MQAVKKIASAITVICLIIGLFIGLGYTGYRYYQNKKKGEEKLRYTFSERGDLKVILKETATLRPRTVVEVKSKVSGRIVKLHYEAGAVVSEGSVIAEIDREQYERNLEIAENDLRRAKQAWKALLPEGKIVTEPEKLEPRAMETLIDEVLIRYAAAKVNYINMKEMYARDLISLKALDDAEQNYDTAYVAYHQSILQASKTLTEAQVAYEDALENLSETTIRAPVSGILTKLMVEEGELVQGTGNMSPGTSIAEVADLSDMIAVVKLNEVDVGKVKVGDPVTLTVDAHEDVEIKGEVESISPSGETVNNIVTFEVKINLPERYDFFKPEMTANADILVDIATDVVKVPLEAIEEKKGTKKVKILVPSAEAECDSGSAHAMETDSESDDEDFDDEDGDFYRTRFAPKVEFTEKTVEIETGLTNELWAEVVSGVSEGARLKLPDLNVKKKEFEMF